MKAENLSQAAVDLHKKLRGKIRIEPTKKIKNAADLSLVYTPGVGRVSELIAENPHLADEYTWRKNAVAIVSDGTAVLGLGDIGPEASLPVLEGKSVIFKQFAGIDAVPIALATKDTDEIVRTIELLAPSFGAIQLEDISAPRCFEIERALMERLDIPVMHDDQHGTAIVVLAGLINALKVTNRRTQNVKVVVNGVGAAGVAIMRLLKRYLPDSELTGLDSKGIIWSGRGDLAQEKLALVEEGILTTEGGGGLDEALRGADVFIGVSKGGLLNADHIRSMNSDPIIFALANPVPEIMPDEARVAGAAVVATGRSDFPNQVNNALCYPGLFRGMLDGDVKRVTDEMKIRAAEAIAGVVAHPDAEHCIPSIFDERLHEVVAESVAGEKST
jgi:malate dehydrogenase (oxaloacetate-decarboxylating)